MKRLTAVRLCAVFALLVQSGAFGATTLLDSMLASRANATVAHVEEDAGATCVAHDESTCQICRVANTTLSTAPHTFVAVPLVRAARPTGYARAHFACTAQSALRSRAPPVA